MRKIIFSWPVIVIMAVFVLWIAIIVLREYGKARIAKSLRMQTEAELGNAEERLSLLREKIKDIESEAGLEKIFREKYNTKKPGEHVIVITEGASESDSNNSGTSSSGFLHDFWTAIKNIF